MALHVMVGVRLRLRLLGSGHHLRNGGGVVGGFGGWPKRFQSFSQKSQCINIVQKGASPAQTRCD